MNRTTGHVLKPVKPETFVPAGGGNEEEAGGSPLVRRSKAGEPSNRSTDRKTTQVIPSQQTWILLEATASPHVFVNTAGMSCWDFLERLSFTWWMCASAETQGQRYKKMEKRECCLNTGAHSWLVFKR